MHSEDLWKLVFTALVVFLAPGCNSTNARSSGSNNDAGTDTDTDSDTDTDTETELDTTAPLRTPTLEWLRCFSDELLGEASAARSVVSLPNGDLVVGGEFHGVETGDSYTIVLNDLGELQETLTWAPLGETDPPGSIEVVGLTVDEDGALYAAGHFAGSISLASGGPTGVEIESTDGSDAFVAALSPDAGPEWVATIAGVGDESVIGNGIDVDASGGVVVTGMFQPPAIFGAGSVGAIELPVPDDLDASYNLFVAAFDPSGNVQWARQDGGSSRDSAHAVACATDGSVYAAGIFGAQNGGSATFGLGEDGETTVDALGISDAFVSRYREGGGFDWVATGGGASTGEDDVARDLAVLETGSVIVLGNYGGLAIFGAGEENETVLRASPKFNGFIASYENDGLLEWARWFGSDEEDSAPALATDGAHIYVVGVVRDKAVFGHGEPNQSVVPAVEGAMYLAAYNYDGSLNWLSCVRGTLGLNPFDDIYSDPHDVIALGEDRFVIAGSFRGEIELGDDKDGVSLYCSSEAEGAYVAKYRLE